MSTSNTEGESEWCLLVKNFGEADIRYSESFWIVIFFNLFCAESCSMDEYLKLFYWVVLTAGKSVELLRKLLVMLSNFVISWLS